MLLSMVALSERLTPAERREALGGRLETTRACRPATSNQAGGAEGPSTWRSNASPAHAAQHTDVGVVPLACVGDAHVAPGRLRRDSRFLPRRKGLLGTPEAMPDAMLMINCEGCRAGRGERATSGPRAVLLHGATWRASDEPLESTATCSWSPFNVSVMTEQLKQSMPSDRRNMLNGARLTSARATGR